jgi:hypothetical protein
MRTRLSAFFYGRYFLWTSGFFGHTTKVLSQAFAEPWLFFHSWNGIHGTVDGKRNLLLYKRRSSGMDNALLYRFDPQSFTQIFTNYRSSIMSTGTATYLPSANLTIVRYPAKAVRDCDYTIDQRTGDGTIINGATAPLLTGKASVDLSWHSPTATKRANASWTIQRQTPTHWEEDLQLSAKYPGRTDSFYVPVPGRPGYRMVAVASGVTEVGGGVKRAAVMTYTGVLEPYPVRQAENAPITNFAAPSTPNGTSRG